MSRTTGRRPERVTIMDVARAAGVSVATVSKVTNGRDGIAEATTRRVLAVVDELGYEASIAASGLRRKRTKTIGVLAAEVESCSAEFLKGISRAVVGSGYELFVQVGGTPTHVAQGWERRMLSRLGQTLFDGAIVVAPSVRIAGPAGIPVVPIDPPAGSDRSPSVDADSLHGARLATRHLLDLGHRRIAFLGGRPDLRSARLREDGFRAAYAERGLTPDPALIRVGGYHPSVTDGPAHELLRLPVSRRPTAVFAANDRTAIRVLEIAAALGLRVPDDLSVVGYDDVPEAAAATPPLTTIHQPLQELGGAALRLLLAGLNGTDDRHTTERCPRLPVTLLVRGSTAPPRTTLATA